MQYKLLSVSKYLLGGGVNIGDFVQALASSQYYPCIDGFLERDDDLKSYNGAKCAVIMNGWYMHNPSNWPPSNNIIPLFVAFHLNSTVKKELTSSESIAYLKQHEPIGCRDLLTLNILKENNVDAYFSGCMTLTLGKKYKSIEKEDVTYIVDPQINVKLNTKKVLSAISTIISHPKSICKLLKERQLALHNGRNVIKKLLKTAIYYREYARVFGHDFVMNSVYICQENRYYKEQITSDEDRLKEAERIIRLYAKAKLVITSRIHCALPCLGIETPVIYLEKVQDTEESICRLDGLRDLFNIIKVDNSTLKPDF